MSFIWKEKRGTTDYTLAEMLATRDAGYSNWSGEKVNEVSALGISTVMACVSILADSIAVLPIRIKKYVDDRMIYQDSPNWLRQPNANQQKFGFIHEIVAALALHGNAYVFVDRDRQDRVVAVNNISPQNVEVNMKRGVKTYKMKDGTILTNRNMLHIILFPQAQQAVGPAPLNLFKNTFGMAIAMERHINQFYSQGATPSSVLETDRELTPEQAEGLQATWLSHHSRSRRPAILTGGLKWRGISEAAGTELVAAREQVVNDIARIYRIPTYLINSKGDSQTYSNVQSAGINFIRHTLEPYIYNIESALSTLVPGRGFVNMDTSKFSRGDQLSTFRAAQVGISTGIITPNEAREWIGYEPYENGNEFYLGIQGAAVNEAQPIGTDPGSFYDGMGQDEDKENI